MKNDLNVAAVDLGAESGRVILVKFSEDGFQLNEIHRFRNQPVRVAEHLFWNTLGLFHEIKNGLKMCSLRADKVESIGVDTWGVDFALLDARGDLIGNPYHYRDNRTDGMVENAFELVTRAEIFDATGIQFMQLNSLYQLLSMKDTPALERANYFLTMPDLFNYWLSGNIAAEFSNATTTQMYDQRKKDWARGMLGELGLPTNIYPDVIPPGTVLGNLTPSVMDETGLGRVPVIAPACHDTGSAVAAIPVSQDRFAYISSGTWSLVGGETDKPVINEDSLRLNFTNEGGVEQTVRLLKNVAGLWLLQECRRIWAQQGEEYSYPDLVARAKEGRRFAAFVDPDAIDFLAPHDMPKAIYDFCKRTNQNTPETKADILRVIFESLAMKYRYVLANLEELTGQPIEVIHVIGGGSQNELLNQLTSDASGKLVIAGPVEATALGNAMVQAVSLGYFENIWQARKVMSDQISLNKFEPQQTEGWNEAYNRFLTIMAH